MIFLLSSIEHKLNNFQLNWVLSLSIRKLSRKIVSKSFTVMNFKNKCNVNSLLFRIIFVKKKCQNVNFKFYETIFLSCKCILSKVKFVIRNLFWYNPRSRLREFVNNYWKGIFPSQLFPGETMTNRFQSLITPHLSNWQLPISERLLLY